MPITCWKRSGERHLPCIVHGEGASLHDAFDAYGRFVGQVEVRARGESLVLNQWLAESGWALPTFYDSITTANMNEITARAAHARSRRRGVWAHYRDRIAPLDRPLRDDRTSDRGAVILPKLFRRAAMWCVRHPRSPLGEAWLTTLRSDACFLRENPNASLRLDELVVQNKLKVRPEEIVFRDARMLSSGISPPRG